MKGGTYRWRRDREGYGRRVRVVDENLRLTRSRFRFASASVAVLSVLTLTADLTALFCGLLPSQFPPPRQPLFLLGHPRTPRSLVVGPLRFLHVCGWTSILSVQRKILDGWMISGFNRFRYTDDLNCSYII